MSANFKPIYIFPSPSYPFPSTPPNFLYRQPAPPPLPPFLPFNNLNLAKPPLAMPRIAFLSLATASIRRNHRIPIIRQANQTVFPATRLTRAMICRAEKARYRFGVGVSNGIRVRCRIGVADVDFMVGARYHWTCGGENGDKSKSADGGEEFHVLIGDCLGKD